MADITNTMNASTPINAGSGHIISPEPPESVLLSPGVREAMDLIFPKSATQLLQRGLPFEEDKFLGVSASKENLHPGTAAAPTPHVNAITLPCSMSSAYITTTTTTCAGMTASSEVVTSAYGNGSPALSLSPFVSTYTSPVCSSAFKSQEEAKDPEVESKNIELSLKNLAKIRISKSDLEIISSDDSVDESHEKSSRRGNSVDFSRDESDSEDMMRPFVSTVKEKKKQKKKKKNTESDSLLWEINVKLSKQITELAKSSFNSHTQSLSPDGSNVADSSTETPKQNSSCESLPHYNLNNVNTSHMNSHDISSHSWMFTNGSLANNLHNNSGMASDDISNISFSPAKENLHNEKGKSKQSLPEIKRLYFNIVKHKNKIRNSFPPCFVVIKKINVSFYKLKKDFCVTDSVLPLFVRLKHLSDLCDKGSVICKKKKVAVEEMAKKNIFEETILPVVYGEDLENMSGKRSLRKRHKHINYVEPSEDDILDEYSRKRPRMKHKDRSEDESFGESKKRKKLNLSDSKTISSDSVTSVTITPPQNINVQTKVIEKDTTNVIEMMSSIAKQNKVKAIEKANINIAPKEIVVYPPTSSSVQNSYCFRVDGRDMLTSNISGKSKHIRYSKEKAKNSVLVQPPPNISILPPNTLPGAITRHPNAVMVFPSLPLGLTARPLAPGAPISTSISTSGETQKPPQYCVVKMDGADVLLQLVPTSGIDVPVPMVMPKGKTLFVPPAPLVPSPSQLFGQPLQSTLSVPNSTQALPTPLSSVVTASQGNIEAAPLQSLFGIPVINTSSQSVSLPALPIISASQLTSMIPASQLTSITSTASIRPLNLTSSGAYLSQNSTAGLPGHVTVMSSLNSRIASAVTPITSSSLSNQALPAIVASMAAPNTTTVVRSVRLPSPNLRAIAPNQSTSLRSVRIFVPGCSTIGTTGHFATIGTIANSSPLTHLTASSALLPQRKLSSEPELSPEQRAARRRKLEKRYPLPPGVIIKTEPLDAVTKPSCVITTVSGSRSLLSQNLHLLSTSRPGAGFQSIRIISPSLASAFSVRNIRGNSNIIYRSASIGGRQTVLLPTSFGQISTKTTTAVTSTSITTSSFASSSPASLEPTTVTAGVATTTTTAATTTNTTCTSDTTFTSTVLLSSSKTTSEENSSPLTRSPVPQLALSENTLTSMPTTNSESTTELQTEGISLSQTSVITSCESSVPTNAPATSLTTHLNNSCKSSSETTVLANSFGNSEISPDKPFSDAITLENVRISLEELRKMIQIQEARGLKGERLEKLKELLHRKEEHYIELQNLTSVSTSLFAAPEVNCDITGAVVCGDSSQSTLSVDGHAGSETDPFVID